jgi:hypothetical protein
MSSESLRLHVPDEPVTKLGEWRRAIEKGANGDEVILGPLPDIYVESPKMTPVAEWLWTRWKHLGTFGITEDQFTSIVGGAKRELWLWLAGERTWSSVCSALAGRVQRRIS